MKIEEALNRYMETVKEEHQKIESFANQSLAKLGLTGPRCVDRVYSNGNQALSVTYYADSELNRSDGEATGLRVMFDVENQSGLKVKVAAFFRSKPTFDLINIRVIECEGIDNPDHRDLLEGQIRGRYKGSSIKGDSPEMRDQEAARLLPQFVTDSCALLCRLHFRP